MPLERHHNSMRSRSPHKEDRSTHRRRSRSPRPHRHHHGRHHKSDSTPARPLSPTSQPTPPRPLILPFKAVKLSKSDLEAYRPMFASYLDIQKQRDIDEMDEDEVKGRWKSFANRWNRGELAEGWYDPETKRKADTAWAEHDAEPHNHSVKQDAPLPKADADSDDDSDVGPPPPPTIKGRPGTGPSAATFTNLTLRDEANAEQGASARDEIRAARKADRAVQKSRLEELAPRAEPGTKERQLEKKREAGAAAKDFRDARGGGGEIEDVAEGQLMGGAGGREEVRGMRQQEERKKNERELRREEVLRARAAEREERMAGLREKEDKTMESLKAIAKERFGGRGIT